MFIDAMALKGTNQRSDALKRTSSTHLPLRVHDSADPCHVLIYPLIRLYIILDYVNLHRAQSRLIKVI